MHYHNLETCSSVVRSERLPVCGALADYVAAIYRVNLPAPPRGTKLALVPVPGARQWFYREGTTSLGRGARTSLRAFLSGPQRRAMCVPALQRQERLVLVVYRPGVLYRLTGVPQRRLIGVCAPAGEVLGGAGLPCLTVYAGDDLGDGPRGMLRSVEAYALGLREWLAPPMAFDAAVARIATAAPHDCLCVGELADACYMGLRQFERTCLLRLGLSPKVFLRLTRFATAVRMKRDEPAARWGDVAFRCGYFDQMHFIHDFKAFTGSVPSALLSAGDGGWCVFRDRAGVPERVMREAALA